MLFNGKRKDPLPSVAVVMESWLEKRQGTLPEEFGMIRFGMFWFGVGEFPYVAQVSLDLTR